MTGKSPNWHLRNPNDNLRESLEGDLNGFNFQPYHIRSKQNTEMDNKRVQDTHEAIEKPS